jgi:multidrug efflux pump subunit AcrA (membrane-fusion protein)
VTASLYSGGQLAEQPEVAAGSPADGPGGDTEPVGGSRRRWPSRRTTAGQRMAGLLILIGCVLGSAVYVQQIGRDDDLLMTGSVMSAGVLNLNFATGGVVARVLVRVGDQVREGQLLATEAAPGEASIEAADEAAVTADRQQLAVQSGPAEVAGDRAQLARDRSRLASDRQALAQRRIVAPAAGVVTAVDAAPGDTTAPAGVPDYIGPGRTAPVSVPPLFSLLPDAPQVSTRAGAGGSALLPVIQLRTSASWAVLALVPQSLATALHRGQAVIVSVPAARLAGLPGVVREVLATPVETADGDMYEAVVDVRADPADPPLDGMTANVSLVRPGRQ